MSSFALARPEGLGIRSAGVALVGLAALLGFAGVLLPVYALALAAGSAFVALAVWNLAAGVAVFTALTFFEQLPGLSDLPLVKGTGAVLAFSWLISLADRRSMTPVLGRDHPLLAGAAVFVVVFSLASALWATSSGSAISSGIRLAQGILLVFIVYAAVRELRHLIWIIGAFVAGAALTAVVGLAGGTSSEQLGPYAETQRLSGGIGDANEFAALLVPSLVFAAFAMAVVRTALARLALFAALGLVSVALLLTESRGGIVALAVTSVAVAVYAGPLRARALAVLCCVVALGITYYAFVAPPESLTRITHFSAGGGTGRSDLWSIAIEMWRDRPLAGVGAGNFQIVEPRYAVDAVNLARVDLVIDTPKVAHNTYLHVLTELGLIGLAAVVFTIVAALRAATRAVSRFARSESIRGELIARSLVIGAIGMLAAFTFISAQYEKQLWLMLGLLAASRSVSRREPAAALVRDGPPAGRALGPVEPGAEYDPAVSERLAEQLEQRLAERLDALAKEQERLERSRSALTARERELRERIGSLEAAERDRRAESARLDELRARLDEREQVLAALEARLREREEVVDRAGIGVGGEALRAAQAAAERLDSQLAELQAVRAELAERSADLDARARVITELERHGRSAPEQTGVSLAAHQDLERQLEAARAEVEALTRLQDERPQETVPDSRETEERLARRIEAITARELSVARHAAQLAIRERELEASTVELEELRRRALAAEQELQRATATPPAPAPAPVPAPAPAPVTEPEAPAADARGAVEGTAIWSLPELESFVALVADDPALTEQLSYYIVYLRDYASGDGLLPASFDGLLEEVFGDLAARRRE